jgi:hypothetical protein
MCSFIVCAWHNCVRAIHPLSCPGKCQMHLFLVDATAEREMLCIPNPHALWVFGIVEQAFSQIAFWDVCVCACVLCLCYVWIYTYTYIGVCVISLYTNPVSCSWYNGGFRNTVFLVCNVFPLFG